MSVAGRGGHKRLIQAILVTALALAVATPAGAQSSYAESIGDFDIAMTIRDDGKLLVVETIEYDFGVLERHGIYREIDYKQRYDDRHDRVYPIRVLSVTRSEGGEGVGPRPEPYETTTQGATFRIKVGDPDRTISGRHVYSITYEVEGALNAFEDHDELYWNTIGLRWTVPIADATVDVAAPVQVSNATCFTGPERSSLPCGSISRAGNAVRFAQSDLWPGSDLTVVVAIPKGAVPPPEPVLRERWSLDRAFSRTPLTIGATLGLLLLLLGGLASLMWQVGRDRRFVGAATDIVFGNVSGAEERVGLFEDEEGPVEFVPPEGLRPGQVGTLVDEVAHPLDVTATIVDLAVRKYLVIEEIPKEGWLGRPDWRLTKLRAADDDLLKYERLLFNAIFHSRETVLLSHLRTKFHTQLGKVQDALYDDAVARGWFLRRPDKMRLLWTGLGVVAVLVGAGLVLVTAVFTTVALVSLPVLVAGIVLLVGARRMPRRTPKGTGVMRRVLGFREFIATSEADRARFAEQQHLFSQYLPYAIVFGCTEKWARAFEGLAQAPDTSWYTGGGPFAAVAFADTVDSFAVTTVGTMRSTPAATGSSGFSSGGGFSGGGGGGGGGGSW